jgi:pimeloyl-ACP methyl ester carboxylesterase
VRPWLFFAVPAGVYVALCVLMFVAQRSLVYYPVPESAVPGATPMRIAVEGAQLKVWAVERPGHPAVLYFGGNAEDVGASVGRFADLLPQHSLYFVNYRGYGGSTGKPTERALCSDALALYDRIRPKHGEVSVIGRSLGSGVAMCLANQREIRRLVLVTPYDSLVGVARAHFGWLPVGLLMRDRFDSVSRAKPVSAETLVVIASEDEVIPRASSDALVAAFQSTPQLIVLDGAGHNSLDRDPRYFDELAGFLGR